MDFNSTERWNVRIHIEGHFFYSHLHFMFPWYRRYRREIILFEIKYTRRQLLVRQRHVLETAAFRNLIMGLGKESRVLVVMQKFVTGMLQFLVNIAWR
jgi:hypothetical protein